MLCSLQNSWLEIALKLIKITKVILSRWSTSSESRPSSGYRGNPYNTYGSFPYPGGGSVTDTDFYDSGDYDNALDFADDWAEEFAEEWDGDLEEGWNDAYEYWEEIHG